MKKWLNRHLQAVNQVSSRMQRHFGATLMMCGVIGVTLCLPSLFYVVTDNLNRLVSDVKTESQISLFLKLNIDTDGITKVEQQLKANTDIASYRLVTKEQAWQELQKTESAGSIASTLDKNPLPDAFFINPNSLTTEAIAQLRENLQSINGVEKALVDSNWIKRLNGLLELGNKVILVLAGLLGFALIAVIGNTIRMQILTQREEIEVSQLIGATNSFIRCPFLYAGAFYGLGGGLIACLLLVAVVTFFNASVAKIAAEYGSSFGLSLPNIEVSLVIITASTLLGWLAAYLAVNQALVSE